MSTSSSSSFPGLGASRAASHRFVLCPAATLCFALSQICLQRHQKHEPIGPAVSCSSSIVASAVPSTEYLWHLPTVPHFGTVTHGIAPQTLLALGESWASKPSTSGRKIFTFLYPALEKLKCLFWSLVLWGLLLLAVARPVRLAELIPRCKEWQLCFVH